MEEQNVLGLGEREVRGEIPPQPLVIFQVYQLEIYDFLQEAY